MAQNELFCSWSVSPFTKQNNCVEGEEELSTHNQIHSYCVKLIVTHTTVDDDCCGLEQQNRIRVADECEVKEAEERKKEKKSLSYS